MPRKNNMSNGMKSWRLVLGLLCGIAAVLLVSCGGATSLGTKRYEIGNMANWVQAVGSVAAIVGAIWIFWAQRNADRKDKWDGLLKIVAAAQADANDAGAHLNMRELVHFNPQYYFTERYSASAFRDIEEAFAAIPLHEIPYAEAAFRLIALRRKVRELAQLLAKLMPYAVVVTDPFGSPILNEYTRVIDIIRDLNDHAAGVRGRRSEIE